jgi:sugar phosphate isomerase/epimerase
MKLALLFLTLAVLQPIAAETPKNLQTNQLVAWCIVPFDAKQRGPKARAEMLARLDLKRCAYDWRDQHVAEFEEEILQYKKNGIEFFAFWDQHDRAFELFEKHGLRPQIWRMLPQLNKGSQTERVKAGADAMEALAQRTAKLGSKLGLYNHGGWAGEPANLVAVCEELRRRGHSHVGIVYNWHHGHDHINDWAESLEAMKPYLLCLNLNGMNPRAEPKILQLGSGEHDLAMLRTVIESGYEGPVGIIDHQSQLDTESVLRANLAGLAELTEELNE